MLAHWASEHEKLLIPVDQTGLFLSPDQSIIAYSQKLLSLPINKIE